MSKNTGLWSDILFRTTMGANAPAPMNIGDSIEKTLAPVAQWGNGLLVQIAMLAPLQRAAGRLERLPAKIVTSSAEPDSLPRCTLSAARDLKVALARKQPGEAFLWIETAARTGVRAPEEHLPGLLALATAHTTLRNPARQVVGKRGFWLAEQNPDWSWALQSTSFENPSEVLDSGSAELRHAALKQLRLQDPVNALEELSRSEIWLSGSPQDRAALALALETNLGPADEPFLEAMMDEKRKELRVAAYSLLNRLPHSRRTDRMIQRLGQWLSIEAVRANLLYKKPELTINLPEKPDVSMMKDGVTIADIPALGEKAGWLCQAISAIPWSRLNESGIAPEQLLVLGEASSYHLAIIQGLARSAQFHREYGSGPMILPYWFSQRHSDLHSQYPSWNQCTALADREAFLIDICRRESQCLYTTPALVKLLLDCGPIWSAALTEAVGRSLASGQNGSNEDSARRLILEFEPYISESCLQTWADTIRFMSHRFSRTKQWENTIERREQIRQMLNNLRGN